MLVVQVNIEQVAIRTMEFLNARPALVELMNIVNYKKQVQFAETVQIVIRVLRELVAQVKIKASAQHARHQRVLHNSNWVQT